MGLLGETFGGIRLIGDKVMYGGDTWPVAGTTARVEQGAVVEDSVLMNGVLVGEGAVVRHAIVDKEVKIPPGATLGVDPEHDRARGFVVQDGLTVLGKGQAFPDA